MIRIEIKTDNAAFESPDEISRILRNVTAMFEGCNNNFDPLEFGTTHLHDSNGNTVGKVTVE